MDDPSRPTFNNLFIDLNGLIHRAVTAARLRESRCTADFLSEFFRSVDLLVQLSRPTDLLFIAADGPAPLAMSVEQRATHFASAGGLFDRCAITPGTEFMMELHSEILRFIADQRSSDVVWSRPRVIYSGPFVPGEGEHKIMEFIRGRREAPDWPPDQVHCFYSTDTDFILLTLQTHEPFCCVIRESDSVARQRDLEAFKARIITENWGWDAFDIVHISLVREYLALDFGGDDVEGLVDDFVGVGLLIENDLIPDFHDIDVKDGGFDTILSIYRSIGGRLVDRGRFKKPMLKVFLTMVRDFHREKFRQEHQLEEPQVAGAYAKANREWLAGKLPDADFERLLEKMATGILEAFWWVLQYCACGCPSWDWMYRFHFSPPLEYVLPFVEHFEPAFEHGQPNPPFLLQLATLPPRSADLLPASLRPLLRPGSPLADLYPTMWRVDGNSRRTEWRDIQLLPFVDIARLRTASEAAGFSEAEVERNAPGQVFEFRERCAAIEVVNGKIFEPVDRTQEWPPCIPRLSNIPLETEDKCIGVHVFEHPYKGASLLLKLVEFPPWESVADVAEWIALDVLVGWPFLRPARIVGAVDSMNVLKSDGSIVPRGSAEFPGYAERQRRITQFGTDVGEIKVFFQVQQKLSDGTFAADNDLVPVQTILPFDASPADENFRPPPAREPRREEKVVVFRDPSGPLCFVGELVDPVTFDISIFMYPELPGIRKMLTDDKACWVKLDVFVKEIRGLSFRGLRFAMSQVIVAGKNTNIAFCLFEFGKVVEGCSKIINRERLFAKSLIDDMKEYFAKAGDLKQLIMNSIQPGERRLPEFTLQQLFGGSAENQERKYRELTEWLAEKGPLARFPLVSESAEFLATETVTKLEQLVIGFNFAASRATNTPFDRDCVLWRGKSHPEQSVEMPALGTRVVSIAPSGPAGFGRFGTVIARDPVGKLVTVLFDEQLPCATRLERKLITNRGLRVDVKDVLVAYKP